MLRTRLRRWPTVLCVLTVTIGAGSGSVVAQAGTGGSAATQLSATPDLASFPVLVAAGDSGADALWEEMAFNHLDRIWGAHWSASTGRWSARAQLSPNGIFDAEYASVAASPSGAAVASWESGAATSKDVDADTTIQASWRSRPSGTWTAPVTLSVKQGGRDPLTPVVGIDGSGMATVVWSETSPALNVYSSLIDTSSRSPATGRWSAPTTIINSRLPVSVPQLAVAPDGAAVAVWDALIGTATLPAKNQRDIIYAAVRPAASSAWSRPFLLGTDVERRTQYTGFGATPGPRVAVAADGRAVVVWQAPGAHDAVALGVAVLSSAGQWSEQTLPSGSPTLMPDVATAADGRAVITWTTPAGVWLATERTPTSRSFVTSAVSIGSGDQDAQVATSSDGHLAVTWSGPDDSFAAIGLVGARQWCSPLQLGHGILPEATFTAPDSGLALWVEQPTNETNLIETRRIAACGT